MLEVNRAGIFAREIRFQSDLSLNEAVKKLQVSHQYGRRSSGAFGTWHDISISPANPRQVIVNMPLRWRQLTRVYTLATARGTITVNPDEPAIASFKIGVGTYIWALMIFSIVATVICLFTAFPLAIPFIILLVFSVRWAIKVVDETRQALYFSLK